MTRIVVVDDDPSILSLMGAMAADRGWEVVPSTDSATFFAALEEERTDVLVVDLWLRVPDNGWDIVKRLKSDPATSSIPVVLCSGDVFHLHDQQAMLDRYASAVLVKPFEIDDFYRCVEHALSTPPPEEQEKAEGSRPTATETS